MGQPQTHKTIWREETQLNGRLYNQSGNWKEILSHRILFTGLICTLDFDLEMRVIFLPHKIWGASCTHIFSRHTKIYRVCFFKVYSLKIQGTPCNNSGHPTQIFSIWNALFENKNKRKKLSWSKFYFPGLLGTSLMSKQEMEKKS